MTSPLFGRILGAGPTATEQDVGLGLFNSGLVTMAGALNGRNPFEALYGGIEAGRDTLKAQNDRSIAARVQASRRELMAQLNNPNATPEERFALLQQALGPALADDPSGETAKWITQAMQTLGPIMVENIRAKQGGPEKGTWVTVPGPGGKPYRKYVTQAEGPVEEFVKPEAPPKEWTPKDTAALTDWRSAIQSDEDRASQIAASYAALDDLRRNPNNVTAKQALLRSVAMAYNKGPLGVQDVEAFKIAPGIGGKFTALENFVNNTPLNEQQIQNFSSLLDAVSRNGERMINSRRSQMAQQWGVEPGFFRNPYEGINGLTAAGKRKALGDL